MKKRKNWKENLVTALEVPRDLGLKETVITVSGRNQARIENYRSILRYREEEIVILTFHGPLVIRGKSLGIQSYAPEEMLIQGKITQIILDPREGR